MSAKDTRRSANSRARKRSKAGDGRVVSVTLDEARARVASGQGRTDWARVDALTDADIARAVAEDPDAPPLLDDAFWKNAALLTRAVEATKSTITIRIDDDVLADLKRLGPGYQSRINAVLRAYTAGLRRKAS